jgi:hypothetical protein
MIEFQTQGRNVSKFFFVLWGSVGFGICIFALMAAPKIEAALTILMWIGGMLFIGIWGLLCGIKINSENGLPVFLDPNAKSAREQTQGDGAL